MSLHIGNLSSRTRRDDLERVFRRFGRCTIQVKDKYGFVVYDYPAFAEKALKTLRGTRVCGEAITLSWSKQQPRVPQRFLRGGKSYEPPRIRYPVKENADRRLGSNNRRDHARDFKRAADGEVRKKLYSSNLVDESMSYKPYDSNVYMGESDQTSPNDRKNHLEDDRWGEQVLDPTKEKYTENGVEFDRYEPHHSDGKKESDERQHISPLARSHSIRTSRERKGNTYNRISEKNSRRRLRPRKGFRDKKRNRRDYENRDKNHLERAKGPSSSSIHSDYTSSRSWSPSRPSRSLSRSRSPSKSKSVPSKQISRSSPSCHSGTNRSRSPSKSKSVPSKQISRSSPSCHSGTKNFNSRSTSRLMSPNSSLLPVEQLTRHVSPSPNERQKDSKDSAENAVGLAHSNDLSEGEILERNGTGTFKYENITFGVENEFETNPAELKQEDMKDLSENDDEHCHSVSRGSRELSYVPQSNSDGHIIDNSHLQNEDFVGEHILALEYDISTRSNSPNSARISLEEMYMVLKHYGLQYPEEKEKDLPVETYFGSARLWPWEMIYYRRLKKGPISTENYSRRIAQNEEFGIVDKYIRGSSGWGELN